MQTRHWPQRPAHLASLPRAPHAQSWACRVPSSTSYLDGGHPDLLPDQDPAVLQGGDVGLLHLHEVGHQVRDVHLPVGTEQVAQLSPRAGALRHELGEDPHGGALVL